MKNLKIEETEITWETKNIRHGSNITREYLVLNHGDHLSLSCVMRVEGKIKNTEMVHLPLELIDNLKDLKECED